jgi:glycosyltransferase involved in cell wall biosynthesis
MTQAPLLSIRLLSHSATQGGAALAVASLHKEFCRAGVKSRLMVSGHPKHDDQVEVIRQSSKLVGAARKFLDRPWRTSGKRFRHQMSNGNAFEYLSVPYANSAVTVAEVVGNADLLMLGWVARTFDWRVFFEDVGTVPIIWRLADLNPLTGGCHYPDQCTGFMSGCRVCPQVSGTLPCKETSSIWKLKQEILTKVPAKQLTFVSQSRWLESLVRSSPLASRFRCVVIPNGVERDVFFPCERSRMKKTLGIPEHIPAVTVCAGSMTRRKGLQQFINELTSRKYMPDFALIWIGHQPEHVPASIRFLPFTSQSRDDLRIAYSAGDVLAFPSFQDNCPNTVLESLACGTPVLAFNGCGTEELIRNQVDGLLVRKRTISDFVDRLFELISSPRSTANLQAGAVQSPAGRRSIADAAQDYLSVFRQSIDRMSSSNSITSEQPEKVVTSMVA